MMTYLAITSVSRLHPLESQTMQGTKQQNGHRNQLSFSGGQDCFADIAQFQFIADKA